jgi:SSS family solute:Na+ symporter
MDYIDLLIVSTFFLIVFIIGIWDRKKVTIDDYWVNNRKTGTFVLLATTLSSFIGAGAIIGGTEVTYSGAGLAASILFLSYFLYFFIFAKYFAPKIKEFGDKHNAYTIPDYFEHRYSQKVRLVGAIVNLISWSLYIAIQILAMGAFISVLANINPIIGTIIGSLIVILYTSIGGLRADIRTDIFQFFVMLFLVLIFMPIVIYKGGGFPAIQALPLSFLSGEKFMPWPALLFGFIFIGSGVITSADIWQRTYAAKDKKTVSKAMTLSGLLVFAFIAMTVIFGIYSYILIPGTPSNMVIPILLKTLLPAGLAGLVIAGFFAAIMSTADTVLLISSMTLVHDIYIKTLGKTLSPEKTLKLSRLTTLILGLIALIIAIVINDIAHLTLNAVSFYTCLMPSIVFGFYWKKANSTSALWSIVFGFLATFAVSLYTPTMAFIAGIVISMIVFVLISLLVHSNSKSLDLQK